MSNANRTTHLSDIEGKNFPVLCVLTMIASIFGAWMMHPFNPSSPNSFFILFTLVLVYMVGIDVKSNVKTVHVEFFKDDEYRGFVKRELWYVMNDMKWVFWFSTIPSVLVFFFSLMFKDGAIFVSTTMLFNIFITMTMLNLGSSVDVIRNESVSEQLLNMKNS